MMRAIVFHKPKKITVDTVPDPEIEQPTDVVLRVTSTCICGSDLHLYNGHTAQREPLILGHEFMGIVEDVGADVKKLKKGDRVIVPFPVACGTCYFCQRQLGIHCERGGGMFGHSGPHGGYPGGQAEYVRVPYADIGARKIPDSLTDDQVIFLTDIFPTGYAAIDWCQLQGGETVAVWGAGPVGLMAMKAAWMQGAGRVIAIDREPYRLDRAARVGNAEVIDMVEANAIDLLRDGTQGHGPDVCIDAVGMEAHHGMIERLANVVHLQTGSLSAFKECIHSVRRGGVVSVVGMYGGLHYDNVPLGEIFDKGLRMCFGHAPVHRYIDDLMAAVETGKVRLDDVISHRMPLSAAPEAYQMFNDKTDNCVKVVLKAS